MTAASIRSRLGFPARTSIALWAWLTGLAWAGIMAERLFAGGTVGMADNGDGRRLLCQLGVRVARPYTADSTKFVYPVYVAHRWYGEACGADGSGEPYRSSQLWLLSLTKHLTGWLGFSGTLDLRALGLLASLLVGIGVGLLVAVLPGRWWIRVVVASVFGLVMADSSVAEYFVSPYSEPAALLGALFLCVALLWMWRGGATTWPGLAAVALVGSFTMAAKTQAVAWLPALVLAVLWLPHDGTRSRPVRASRKIVALLEATWHGSLRRLPALLTSVALLGSAVVILHSAPQRFNQIDAYDEVFSEILVHSSNPRADLRWLGVDPGLAYARGSNVLSSNSAARSVSYLQFRSHVTEPLILKFYLTHPTRLAPVFGDGLHAMAVWRENYLGSYTASTSRTPGQIEHRIVVFTDLFEGWPGALFIVVWLATLGFGILTARDKRAGMRERAVGRLAVVLAVATAFAFWAVMLGEGYSDLFKHMVLANQLFAFGFLTFLFCLTSRFRARLRFDGTALLAAPAPQNQEPEEIPPVTVKFVPRAAPADEFRATPSSE